MDHNEVWKNKITKNPMKILSRNPDGSIKVTFDFGYTPKRVYDYQRDYIQEHYEYAGYKSTWSIDKSLMDLTAKTPTLEDLNMEDILFSDHTGEEEKNVYQRVKLNDGEKPLIEKSA